MGMYTEIFFRAKVGDLPDEAVGVLQAAHDGELWEKFGGDVAPIDHPFFHCDRWMSVFTCSSSYFRQSNTGTYFKTVDYPVIAVRLDFDLRILTSLKDYDNEIEKFFDWIMPYVKEPSGSFLGYELYEEGNSPLLYFKPST